jgi:hypothetical protein
MKFIDEFRDRDLARGLATAIAQEAARGRTYRLMEFCGGHTHAIFRYGVQDLMPANVRFVHGPGCPVCVLPTARLDLAIAMTERHSLTLCTYADLMRVPASNRYSLLKAKAAGADIRMVYSTQDALAIARANPEAPGGLFRHRLRDHHPAHRRGPQAGPGRRAREFQRLLQPRPDPPGHARHPGDRRSRRASPSMASWGPPTSAPSSAPSPMTSSLAASANPWSSPASSP